ncbi:MAG: DUF2812 domain-containing protein [Oscillospiraceae bacterium]|nr:DUF2812 domain-containing protein [Oscillospiraceae bacterium]MBR5723466.1 DUF2812 domain-containing protein [Oscillospiraceae bacterium]
MKQKFHKLFWVWEYEKEEQWLNAMAEKGFGLCHVGFCTYWFDDIEPGEYSYYLELAENHPGSVKGKEYLDFLSECGIDYVGNYLRWTYLRKKTADGPFELHADLDSKLAHLKRIMLLLLPLAFPNIWSAYLNLHHGLTYHSDINILVSGLNLTVFLLLLYAEVRIGMRVHKLKKERQLHE